MKNFRRQPHILLFVLPFIVLLIIVISVLGNPMASSDYTLELQSDTAQLPPDTTPAPPTEQIPIPTDVPRITITDVTGPSTKGSLIIVANKDIQLPDDAYVAHYIITVTCLANGPKCPETPMYVLTRGNSTIHVSIPSGTIVEEKIGEGDQDPFKFLKEILK